jgi:hypothetical protein
MTEASVRDGARSALIVATSRYDDPALRGLRGAAADADALAQVLSDPRIGGFDIRTVVDQPAHVIAEAVEEFFADRSADDLLVLHFSGHGIKNQTGELHFAATNTKLARLGSTAIAAQFVNRQMTASRSRRIVLLLDCCYAGAFDRGMAARAGPDLDIKERFGGRGRAVITASGALEYAFEGNQLSADQSAQPSMFTSAMVRGLSTGEADRNQDGWVGLDELYDYIYDAVRTATPDQTPGKWTFGLEGDLHLARRGRPVTAPSALPAELQQSLESPLAGVRAGAVQELVRLVRGHHQGLALGARLALGRLTDDDSRAVATAAADALAEVDVEADHEREPQGPTADAAPAGSAGQTNAMTAPTSDAPFDREPDSLTRSRPTPRPSRRLLLALVAGLMLVAAGGLLGWQLWREDAVNTIPASMSGVWNGNVYVDTADVVLTLRFTAGSRSGRQETESNCRLKGSFSEISGTQSRVTMTFIPDKEDCRRSGTITLTTKGNDTLLAEFQPDSGAGSWDAELRRQVG